jgi:hypothetical protein
VVAIEYRNHESWYDVHPLIVEQLKIEKLIWSPSIPLKKGEEEKKKISPPF